MNLILNVQVGAPMTNLYSSPQLGDLYYRLAMAVMNDDRHLVFLDEFRVRRRWDVIVWSIGYCRA
jgi:hypothetical protein